MSRCLFHVGDVFTELAKLEDDSVDFLCCSPPFLALRSYLPADHPDKDKEIGSEATPAAFLSTLLALTREWRRILAPHGSIAVELGDTYSGANGWGDDVGNERYPAGRSGGARRQPTGHGWPLAKSLCLIPSLYAGSLAYGHNLLDPADRIDPWRVRNLIVWHRPNPPVGALGDKVRPSTSYITVACTSDKRWFDLDAERTPLRVPEAATPEGARTNRAVANVANESRPRGAGGASTTTGMMSNAAGAPPLDCWIEHWGPGEHTSTCGLGPHHDGPCAPNDPDDIDGDVWTIPTAPYKGAHYATYPPALPRRLIRLMCPREVCTVCGEPRRRIVEADRQTNGKRNQMNAARIGGSRMNTMAETSYATLGWTDCGHNTWRRGHVLDPFAGSGTTLIAAAEQGRDATGIDLDPRNLDLARERIGLFLSEAG